jgi:REP element-mobilizing transposase RayT
MTIYMKTKSPSASTETTGFQPDCTAGLRPAVPPASSLASSAGISAGSTAGFQPANIPHFPKSKPPPASIRSRGYLPHLEIPGATYFITFRLADSIPKPYLRRLESECNIAIGTLNRYNSCDNPHQHAKAWKIINRYSRTLERYLDESHGACHLKDPQVADIVAGALQFFNSERYELHAWCVLPNHVHVLCVPGEGFVLGKILHSWKSYTAKEANKVLGRTGTFWSREYYDRIVRNEKQYGKCLEYVMGNPAKSGLQDWKWVWVIGN